MQRNCTVLFGTLYLASIPIVTDEELQLAFGSVRVIRGDLVVNDNPTIVTLQCFWNLTSVNNVFIENNAGLVDARLILANINGGIYVENNARLCRSYWPGVTATVESESTACGLLDVSQLFMIQEIASNLTSTLLNSFILSLKDLLIQSTGLVISQVG
jgi:hypothetical protein